MPGVRAARAAAAAGRIGITMTRTSNRYRPGDRFDRTVLAGFIAGGHSGIGSLRHGILADPGKVRAWDERVLGIQGGRL